MCSMVPSSFSLCSDSSISAPPEKGGCAGRGATDTSSTAPRRYLTPKLRMYVYILAKLGVFMPCTPKFRVRPALLLPVIPGPRREIFPVLRFGDSPGGAPLPASLSLIRQPIPANLVCKP